MRLDETYGQNKAFFYFVYMSNYYLAITDNTDNTDPAITLNSRKALVKRLDRI